MFENKPIEDVLEQASSKFQIHPGLMMIEKIPNGIEIFYFLLNERSNSKSLFLLNQLPLLRIFIDKFKKDSFLFSNLLENQINLAKLLGSTFYERALPEVSKVLKREEFVQKMGFEIEFSQRELEVLRLFIGNSASCIAKNLCISKRTAEHHIERIKEKLECGSKADLIVKVRELESYDLLR